MPEFRFRAAAALELRRRQESDAAVVLAAAESALRSAEGRVELAEANRRTAQHDLVRVERGGSDIATLTWHRNWVARLAETIAGERSEVEKAAAVVREAEAAWREARRKRLALERLRERAWRRFQDEERRQEMKVIDELARLRFIQGDPQAPS
jgi:flagellar FliJ protein